MHSLGLTTTGGIATVPPMFDIFESVKWENVARKGYDIGLLTNGVVTDIEDIWGEVPSKFRVHKGNLEIDGPACFGTDDESDDNLYVVAGDLNVKGPLTLRQGDAFGILYVTGSVSCEDCFCEIDASLIVGGSLVAQRLLVTNLHDQGMLVVHGAIEAHAWLEAMGRGFIDFSDLRCPNPLYSGTPDNYETAGRGEEEGEVAYLFDVKTAKDAKTMISAEFFEDDGAVDCDALIAAASSGANVLV